MCWLGFEGDGAIALVFYDRKLMYQWRNKDLRPVALGNFVMVSKLFHCILFFVIVFKKISGFFSACPNLDLNRGIVFWHLPFQVERWYSSAFGSVLRARS